ncbi:hypothetical protein KIPB_000030 [Kipferlia bialata]|uniref:Rab-GAP TBC domain-containing protein n=1 Tax=Kipferlia bialata TaxID=797122 RepID=A0A9K3CNI6_9EUKA|nr:hypothetical protein KIPB_000030 [Kipferlia bialata]|eukprot:g30.t1
MVLYPEVPFSPSLSDPETEACLERGDVQGLRAIGISRGFGPSHYYRRQVYPLVLGVTGHSVRGAQQQFSDDEDLPQAAVIVGDASRSLWHRFEGDSAPQTGLDSAHTHTHTQSKALLEAEIKAEQACFGQFLLRVFEADRTLHYYQGFHAIAEVIFCLYRQDLDTAAAVLAGIGTKLLLWSLQNTFDSTMPLGAITDSLLAEVAPSIAACMDHTDMATSITLLPASISWHVHQIKDTAAQYRLMDRYICAQSSFTPFYVSAAMVALDQAELLGLASANIYSFMTVISRYPQMHGSVRDKERERERETHRSVREASDSGVSVSVTDTDTVSQPTLDDTPSTPTDVSPYTFVSDAISLANEMMQAVPPHSFPEVRECVSRYRGIVDAVCPSVGERVSLTPVLSHAGISVLPTPPALVQAMAVKAAQDANRESQGRRQAARGIPSSASLIDTDTPTEGVPSSPVADSYLPGEGPPPSAPSGTKRQRRQGASATHPLALSVKGDRTPRHGKEEGSLLYSDLTPESVWRHPAVRRTALYAGVIIGVGLLLFVVRRRR